MNREIRPYFVSIDLATARHPQTLLATHFTASPCCGSWSTTASAGARETWFEECEGHTKITYVAEEPRDTGPNVGIPLRREI